MAEKFVWFSRCAQEFIKNFFIFNFMTHNFIDYIYFYISLANFNNIQQEECSEVWNNATRY